MKEERRKPAAKENTEKKRTRSRSDSSEAVSNAVEFTNDPHSKKNTKNRRTSEKKTAREKTKASVKEDPEEEKVPETARKKEKKRKDPSAKRNTEKKNTKARPERKEEAQEEEPVRKSRKAIRKRRNRYRILTGTLLVILLGIIGFISLKVLFVVHRLEVRGTERYSDEEILAFCAIPLDQNIFDVDVDSLSLALPEEFTYIDSAKVKRKLPDKIQINIVDCVPTYYSVNEGEEPTFNIYSQNFKYLTMRSSQPETLMRIDTDLSDEQAFSTTRQLIEIMQKKGYEKVTRIKADDSSLSFIYDNRIRVDLGNMLDIEYKLKMAFHVLEKELSPNERGVIDATKPGQAVFNMEI